jgi:hypothetical protein
MLPLIIFADPPNWQPITGTQYSMIAMVKITLYDNVFEGSGNNVAGAFGPGGESDCRSIGSWIAPNPPAHNGFWYFTIVGNKNGEEITFKIYDAGTDAIYRCNPALPFIDNSTVGDPDFIELSVQESAILGKIKLLTTTPPAGDIVDVAISAGDVTVNPDVNGEYHLAISPGIYDVTSSLNGYTTITLKNILVEQNTVTENINMTLIDWQPITGTQYNMVLVASVKLDNEKFENSNGNKVGAFGPGGEEDCRSVAVWQKPEEDSDGFWYFTIVGDVQNEEISFKLYDGKNDRIVSCNQTINFVDNTTIGMPPEQFIITANTSDIINPGVQTKFKLTQNYPNPFNSTTRIKFSLEKASNVNLTVYNLVGQKVRTLVEAKLDLGEYWIAWDGRDDWGMPVSSGIYLYRMKTDNYSELRKMILSK